MDNKSQKGLASSALAIFTMAVLFFGGLAAATETFAQKEGEIGKETEAAVPQPSVLPAPETGVGAGEETEQLTEVEVVITGDIIDELTEKRPDIGEAIENAGEQVAANVTEQNPEVLGEVEIIITGFEEEVSNATPQEAVNTTEVVNATAVVEEVSEIVVVEQALENAGVNVSAIEGNASEALANVTITAEDIEQATTQVEQEGTVTQELTPEAPTAAEPGKEGESPQQNTTSAIVDAGAEEAVEEAEPELTEVTGLDAATLRQLLERALQLVG